MMVFSNTTSAESVENHPGTLIFFQLRSKYLFRVPIDKDRVVLKSQLYLADKCSSNVIIAEC